MNERPTTLRLELAGLDVNAINTLIQKTCRTLDYVKEILQIITTIAGILILISELCIYCILLLHFDKWLFS